MTDWREAGRKAWATRKAKADDIELVLGLYRDRFANDKKITARRRIIAALRAAGGTTVLDLDGGGSSADGFAQYMRVISVDDGSMKLWVDGVEVDAERKKRALKSAAEKGGYEFRWGAAKRFAKDADVAFLDFCGPWSKAVRDTIRACRHMKAIAVTLMPDHDMYTDATDEAERRLAYEAYMRHAFAPSHSRPTYLRRLCSYKRDGGQAVFVYLLSAERIEVPHISTTDRMRLSEAARERELARRRRGYRTWYGKQDPEVKRRLQERARASLQAHVAADPVFAARRRLMNTHAAHRRRGSIVATCELCGRLGPASPA